MSDRHLRPAKLRWHPLPRVPAIAADPAKPVGPQVIALLDAGVPLVEGAETARDLAISLLEVAAEVEHALMVQYLYLSMSIEGTARREVLQIAIEEMAHLATVQNLLLLVGGANSFHLQRDVRRPKSQHNAIPFVLEPISLSALAKYVAAEAPAKPPPDVADKVVELVRIAEDAAGVAPNRVGAIYALLHWIFLDPDAAKRMIDLRALLPEGSLPANPHLGDADMQPLGLIEAHQLLPEEWEDDREDVLLETPRNRREAIGAIMKIGEQGEGSEEGDNSHFQRFLKLVRQFEDGQIAGLRLPVSPAVDGGGGERGSRLENGYAIVWSRAFNLQYQLIVFGIYHAARLSRAIAEEAELRATICELTMRGMHAVILPVAGLITGLGRSGEGSGPAGPPFELDPAVLDDGEPLSVAHMRLLDTAERAYIAIEGHPDHAPVGDAANRIKDMRRLDRKRRTVLGP